MKACGIIAEYNPFHNGHLYQLSEAKKRTDADVMVVVMSGNFLQRGEPALVDKWTRAKMALASGADLVVELPVSYSVQPADIFAKGAVDILAAFQCSSVSFGSESGNGEQFKEAAKQLVDHSSDIDDLFLQNAEKGKTYAARMEKAIEVILPDLPVDASTPNNQLGLAYAKENYLHSDPFQFEVIERKESEYHDQHLKAGGTIASATAIRKHLLSGRVMDQIQPYMPPRSYQSIENKELVDWECFWPFLKFRILTSSNKELKQIYQMEEGLENRLMRNVSNAQTFDDFINAVKSKRMTRTRLQRLCVYVLLNITSEDILAAHKQTTSRILGFSPEGRAYLNKVKKEIDMNLLTVVNKKTKEYWELDIKAGNVYSLAWKDRKIKQDFDRKPINYIDNTMGN